MELSQDFDKGYICACAEMVRQHGLFTETVDVLRANFLSIEKMRKIGVEESDIEALASVVMEIERIRKTNE